MKRLITALLIIGSQATFAEQPAKIEEVETAVEQRSHSLTAAQVKEMNEIATAIQNNDHAGAFAKLKPILANCEGRDKGSDKRSLYFDTAEEFLEYAAGPGNKSSFRWVIDYCPRAYNHAAFLYVSDGDKDNALKYLDLAIASAPYWAEPHNERGYLLGKLKDFKSAIVSYQRAIELADAHKNSAYVKPLSLRGLGFILTEMGELERAKQAYRDSLVLDPENKLAKNELEYIRQLEAQK